MSIRMMVLIGVMVVLLCVAGGYACNRYLGFRDKENRVDELVASGLTCVESDPDKAITLSLEAREIDDSRPEPLFVLGRANFFKKRYQKALDLFLEGIDHLGDTPELLPEYHFHAGLSALNLHIETGSKNDGREALRLLSNATAEGAHRADAHYALCRLYWQESFLNLESLAKNNEQARRIEEGLEGYPGSGEDGACSHCRMAFRRDFDGTGRAERIVAEGFGLVGDDPGGAIEKGIEAEAICGSRPETCLLLGRAHYLKGQEIQSAAGEEEAAGTGSGEAGRHFRKARDYFKKGLLLPLKEIDLLPEFSYHAGIACMVIFSETEDDVLWQEGRTHLERASRLGVHRADANFALGIYFVQEGYANRNRIVQYWEEAVRIEEELAGYPGSGEDGSCRYCRMEFRQKKEIVTEKLKILKGE